MTTIALGLGTDPSVRAPMVIVVAGGLPGSVILSLPMIPVLFTDATTGLSACTACSAAALRGAAQGARRVGLRPLDKRKQRRPRRATRPVTGSRSPA
jgi:hypothetical protein